jgi:hypothetical protein
LKNSRALNDDYSMQRSIAARGKAGTGFKRVEIPMDEVWRALPDAEPGRGHNAKVRVKKISMLIWNPIQDRIPIPDMRQRS